MAHTGRGLGQHTGLGRRTSRATGPDTHAHRMCLSRQAGARDVPTSPTSISQASALDIPQDATDDQHPPRNRATTTTTLAWEWDLQHSFSPYWVPKSPNAPHPAAYGGGGGGPPSPFNKSLRTGRGVGPGWASGHIYNARARGRSRLGTWSHLQRSGSGSAAGAAIGRMTRKIDTGSWTGIAISTKLVKRRSPTSAWYGKWPHFAHSPTHRHPTTATPPTTASHKAQGTQRRSHHAVAVAATKRSTIANRVNLSP